MSIRGLCAAVLGTVAALASVAAVGLAVLRSVTPTSARAIEAVAFAPVAVPAAGVGVLAALGVALLTRSVARNAALVTAAVLVVTGALACSWIAPCTPAPDLRRPADPTW